MSKIPISKYSKSARKTYRAMVSKYGAKKGKQIFYAKANRDYRGKSKSMKTRAQSVYKKGGTQKPRKR